LANVAQNILIGYWSEFEQRAFVGRTASLFDRLNGPYEPNSTFPTPPGRVESRIARWRSALDPGGHPEALAHRLRHLRIREDQLASLLGEVVLSKLNSLPNWFERLAESQARADTRATVRDLILLVSCGYADRVTACCADRNITLSPGVQVEIRDAIESAAMNALRSAIEHERQVLSLAQTSSLSRALGMIRSARDVDAGTFLLRYPVAGRLLICAAEGCAKNLTEAFVRLSEDFRDLRAALELTVCEPRIAGVSTGISDRHEGGRSVVVIRFDSGERVVYKPKPLHAEAWFKQFLARLSATKEAVNHYPRHLLRDQYGWASYVGEDQPVEASSLRAAEVAGVTLFALYALRAIDIHYENVRIVDGIPIIIDCETLLHPDPEHTPFVLTLHQPSQTVYWQSVLRTTFLPQWMTDPENSPVAVGGSGVVFGLASLDHDHARVAAFESGFRNSYEQAMELDLVTTAAEAAPRGMELRYLLRPTNVYAALLAYSLTPPLLRNGLDRSLELEVLGRYYLSTTEAAAPQEILDAEVRALERLDIPRFSLFVDGTELRESGRTLSTSFLSEPPRSALSHSSRRLSKTDIERQLRLFRIAAAAHISHIEHIDNNQRLASEPIESFDVPALLRVIEGETIGQVIRVDSRGPAWLSIQSVRGTDRYQLAPIDLSLYEGAAGLALYLACSATATGNTTAARLALQTLESAATFCRSEPLRAVRTFGCGGMRGVGAVIYAFRYVGQMLHDESLLEAETRIVEALRENEWKDETPADIVSGTAGLLCVLLGSASHRSSTTAWDAAQRCVDHLQRLARRVTVGGVAWPDSTGRFQTGFAHGSAGVAYALVRYVAAGGSPSVKNLVAAAWDFEDALYDPDSRTWRKYADSDSTDYGYSWCHGAPGILLGRYGHPRCAWLDALLAGRPPLTVLAAQHQTLDQVCCGHTGRALIAADLSALHPTQAAHLCSVQRAEYQMLLDSWQMHHAFSLLPGLPRAVAHLGLMQGTSGIALGLLALNRPDLPAFWRLG